MKEAMQSNLVKQPSPTAAEQVVHVKISATENESCPVRYKNESCPATGTESDRR